MSQPTKINVAFILPQEINDEVCKLSKNISKTFDTDFVLDNKNFIPHISLYWTEYPFNAFKEIAEVVEELSKKINTVEFEYEKIVFLYEYLYMDFIKTKVIQNIHNNFVTKLNKIRQGHLRQKYTNEK